MKLLNSQIGFISGRVFRRATTVPRKTSFSPAVLIFFLC